MNFAGHEHRATLRKTLQVLKALCRADAHRYLEVRKQNVLEKHFANVRYMDITQTGLIQVNGGRLLLSDHREEFIDPLDRTTEFWETGDLKVDNINTTDGICFHTLDRALRWLNPSSTTLL